jgi:hypothetical protein
MPLLPQEEEPAEIRRLARGKAWSEEIEKQEILQTEQKFQRVMPNAKGLLGRSAPRIMHGTITNRAVKSRSWTLMSTQPASAPAPAARR